MSSGIFKNIISRNKDRGLAISDLSSVWQPFRTLMTRPGCRSLLIRFCNNVIDESYRSFLQKRRTVLPEWIRIMERAQRASGVPTTMARVRRSSRIDKLALWLIARHIGPTMGRAFTGDLEHFHWRLESGSQREGVRKEKIKREIYPAYPNIKPFCIIYTIKLINHNR